MSTIKYCLLSKTSESLNENNDCGVRAMSIATGESYEDCHTAFELAGRKHRGCSYSHMYPTVANMLGYNLKTVWRKGNYVSDKNFIYTHPKYLHLNVCPPEYSWVSKCKTPISTERNIPRDIRCIMIVRNHAIGIRDGEVHDWTSGKRHISLCFYIITPKTQSA
jgi:hypothetical protein